MSVTSIGASNYGPWLGQSGNWQANTINNQYANSVGNNGTTATDTVNTTNSNTTNSNATANGGNNVARPVANGGATNVANNGTNGNAVNAANNPADNNNPPPVQAATTPGTGQKVNIIA
jgi:hypothetical protein